MKNYFMKEVDEPLEFGDTLGFDIVKEGDKGQSITKHVECTFIPEIVPLLLEVGVIEEKETEEKPEPIDFSGDESPEEDDDEILDTLKDIEDDIADLADHVAETSKRLAELEKRVNSLEKRNSINNDRKPFSDKIVTDYSKRGRDIFEPLHNWIYEPDIEIFGFTL